MDETVRKALEGLSEQVDKAEGDLLHDSLIVSLNDLGTLVRWAEERAAEADKQAAKEYLALTCDLVEGDDVEVAVEMGFISQGTRGLLVSISEWDQTYPYVVRFKTGRQYVFPRHEIKRVR